MFNLDYRTVGAIRFLKVGRLTVSWSVSQQFRPIGATERVRKQRISRKAITAAYWNGWLDARKAD